MIKKIKAQKQTKADFNALLERIETLAKQSEIINLCATPTGYSWLGVLNAGKSLFPNCTLEIPQYYSNQILSDKQLQQVGETIGKEKFAQLIFNGFNDYFSTIITSAKKINPTIKVGVIYHGQATYLNDNPAENKIFKSLVENTRSKRIDKIGFVKKGFPELFEQLMGVNAYYLVLNNLVCASPQPYENSIGILTNSAFAKNTSTQVVAALSLKDYKVITSGQYDLDYLDPDNNLKALGHLKHADFLAQLGKNIINSHVTFTESAGGQVFTESLALGVPCLTSLTHGYLDDHAELREKLVVDRFDDPWAIAEKMKRVIAEREHLSNLGLQHSKQMNDKSQELLTKFLEA
jgi:hypothetical protein